MFDFTGPAKGAVSLLSKYGSIWLRSARYNLYRYRLRKGWVKPNRGAAVSIGPGVDAWLLSNPHTASKLFATRHTLVPSPLPPSKPTDAERDATYLGLLTQSRSSKGAAYQQALLVSHCADYGCLIHVRPSFVFAFEFYLAGSDNLNHAQDLLEVSLSFLRIDYALNNAILNAANLHEQLVLMCKGFVAHIVFQCLLDKIGARYAAPGSTYPRILADDTVEVFETVLTRVRTKFASKADASVRDEFDEWFQLTVDFLNASARAGVPQAVSRSRFESDRVRRAVAEHFDSAAGCVVSSFSHQSNSLTSTEPPVPSQELELAVPNS